MSAETVRTALPARVHDPRRFGFVTRAAGPNDDWHIVLITDPTLERSALAAGGEVIQREQSSDLPSGEVAHRVTDVRYGRTTFTTKLPDSQRHADVEVSERKGFSAVSDITTVNWSALGSTSPRDAEVYAQLLSLAARWASEQTKDGR